MSTLAEMSAATLVYSTAQLRASMKHPYLASLRNIRLGEHLGSASELLDLLEKEQDRRAGSAE